MQSKTKKIATLCVCASLIAAHFAIDYPFRPHYVITRNEKAYARYSNGKVYIGKQEFLDSIEKEPGDVLVLDARDEADPDMKIIDSCAIKNKDERNEILEILLEYEEDDPSNWYRTLRSMRCEWDLHNTSEGLNYRTDSSSDVDLNNADEEKYNSFFLRKILRN